MWEQALWEVWRKQKNYTQNPPSPPPLPVSMLQHFGLRLRDLHGHKTTEDPIYIGNFHPLAGQHEKKFNFEEY